jgi:hypothetical protein
MLINLNDGDVSGKTEQQAEFDTFRQGHELAVNLWLQEVVGS